MTRFCKRLLAMVSNTFPNTLLEGKAVYRVRNSGKQLATLRLIRFSTSGRFSMAMTDDLVDARATVTGQIKSLSGKGWWKRYNMWTQNVEYA
jgi:hypothetical protein